MRARLAFALLLGAAPGLAAQGSAGADSAWEAGDRPLAQRRYEALLAANPQDSHATFRLAQLAADPRRALRLYRRYVTLEPRDAWGWMALGDQLGRMRRRGDALAAYQHAEQLRPDGRDLAIGRARILSRAGQSGAAAAQFEGWAAEHHSDAEVWQQAGQEWRRAGRPGHAARAFAQAVAAGAPGAAPQLLRARAAHAPAVEPTVEYLRDSDGNRTGRLGLRADWAVRDGTRLGAAGSVASISDGSISHRLHQGSLRLSLGAPRFLVNLAAGGARFERGAAGPARLRSTGELRLRLRAAAPGGPSLDLRAQRGPLGTTPLLVEQLGMRNEAKALAELPFGPLRLRGGGRFGVLQLLGETNTRWGGDGMLVLPLGWQAELSAQYHRLQYSSPARLGYFAPKRVETVEGGTYAELEGPLTLAFDLGAGVQRLQEFGEGPGPWRLTLRGWSALGIPFAPGRELRFELEGYDAPFAPEGVSTSARWKSLAVSAGIRWAFR
ncbi:MAG TPA: hypothetical protein VL241_07980 [Gemmatimonadales bacterium]|nr:hypothetical protein [Gemmatimonadales bacterium]